MNFLRIFLILFFLCACSKSEDVGSPTNLGIFVRGSFNAWGKNINFLESEPNHFLASLQLPAGKHEFKIADADWKTLDLGVPESYTISLGTAIPLVAKGKNMILDLDQEKTNLVFSLSFTEQSGYELTVIRGKLENADQ